MYDHRVYFSDKNFVAIEIETEVNVFLLILNLASRNRYWIEVNSLEEKILAKITDLDGELFDLKANMIGEPEIHQMKVRPNQIEMKYHIRQVYESSESYDFAEMEIG